MEADLRRLQFQFHQIPETHGPRVIPNKNITISLNSGLTCNPAGGNTGRIPVDEEYVREYIVDPSRCSAKGKVFFKSTSS